MKRREFITLLGGAAAALCPLGARAQQTARPARIGLLAFGQGPVFDGFREEMTRLGHVEGRTYLVEFRSAHGDPDRLQSAAMELVRLPVDVILTDSGAASIAASRATASVPVVMGVVSDPVGLSLVASLARPEGT
jgi:putative tryptophan/tyrosine transport system substrate-binding protein